MMRKIILSVMLTIFLSATAQVNVEITSGISSPTVKKHIEREASKLFSAINRAFDSGSAINYTGIDIDPLASSTIGMSWNQSTFGIEDDDIVTIAITQKKRNGAVRGYQIRNIPIIRSGNYGGSQDYNEISVDFSPSGKITDFNFTMPTHIYTQLIKKGEVLNDLDQRLQIIHWCEQFAKAYQDKNLAFLNDIFSDDALIITGKLKFQRKKSDVGVRDQSKVEYITKTKKEYLNTLANQFRTLKYIDVKFKDYRIVRHGAKPNYYGVTLVQDYRNSSGYADTGTLFLVWDFSNEDEPKIHVRTWQPLTEKEFELGDFKLP